MILDQVYDDKPSAARVYDYYLGGFHHFEIDRTAADRVLTIYPDIAKVAQVNRAFLRRAVTFLCNQGIDQFLDIGSGIPTAGNTHEVVAQHHPHGRTVYVDIDPVAVHHSLALLKDVPDATAIQGDIRQPEAVMDHPEVQALLDFSRPVAILLVAILPFIPDDTEALHILSVFKQRCAPGSSFAMTQGTRENAPDDALAQIEQLYSQTVSPIRFRPRTTFERFFDGLELAEPGITYAPLWHPESEHDLWYNEPERALMLVGVGWIR